MSAFDSLFARMPREVVEEQPRDYFQFLFLYERTSVEDSNGNQIQSELFIHPFYGTYSHTDRAYSIRAVLYPVFYSHGTNYWKRWSVLYFWTGEDLYHQDTKNDQDFFLAPFLFWGSGETEEDNYFSVFPIAGTIKDKFGWDELNFFLFPVYSSWERNRYKAYSIVWPLIMWGGDGMRRSDFRVLPLYSSKVHRGKYNMKTVLWPIFQWGSQGLDAKDPRHHFLFLPFYAHKYSESGQMEAYSILYPFSLVAWGRDDAVNAKEFRMFWFLYQNMQSDSPYIRKHVIFPFYAHYQFGSPELEYYKTMDFYLILIGNLRTRSAIIDSSYDFFIPFYYSHSQYYKKEDEYASALKLWPLFHSFSDTNGSNGWQTLTLWPFPDDYIDRTWGPLYSLAEYREHTNGDQHFGLFLRIYSQYWNEEDKRVFLAGFDYRNSTDHFHFRFLGGLLGFQRHRRLESDTFENTLQLFWFDI